jgi:beta-aspartyl-peptidase (threonine type)
MDAAVMTSAGAFGAVAAVKEVRNPTLVARLVMEKTDHIMLGGEGAVRFARLMGLRRYDPRTKRRMNEWRRLKRAGKSEFLPRLEEMKRIYCSTVGVVAIDRTGLISVATSTGGMPMRLPGRVGDTPMLGAGTYATADGGVSATGHGEMIIKHLIAMRAVKLMKNRSALLAGRRTVDFATRLGLFCGLIGVDRQGRIVVAHNTPGMTWCYVKDGVMGVFDNDRLTKGLQT